MSCSLYTVSPEGATDAPQPALAAPSSPQRLIDVDNMQAITVDEDLRMANEDINRFFLLDRPSRLARWRMPH